MIVTLLTDYGLADEFVGVVHGVIRGIVPGVEIVDITHAIRRHDIRHGALTLRDALPYMPVGVHVAVVDPQVGTERRAIAVRCGDGRLLVGPDNGLLSLAWDGAGGAVEAADISRSPHRLEPLSATFHGRDVFAPVAAHLAVGAPLADAGDPFDVAALATIDLPVPKVERGLLVGHVLGHDIYGNVRLDLTHADAMAAGLTLGRRVTLEAPAGEAEATLAQTFADVPPGELLVYEDAFGALAVALNRGDAAARLGAVTDAELTIAPR